MIGGCLDRATRSVTVVLPAPLSLTSTVTPPADLAKSVEFELFRTGAFDTSKIAIKAEADSVTLAGTVRSIAEQCGETGVGIESRPA